MLQRERQSGPGCQSCASVQAWTLRARPDLPPVRPSLGKTHRLCVPLRCGQRCVLVSVSCYWWNGNRWCIHTFMFGWSSYYLYTQTTDTCGFFYGCSSWLFLFFFMAAVQQRSKAKSIQRDAFLKEFMLLAQNTFEPSVLIWYWCAKLLILSSI